MPQDFDWLKQQDDKPEPRLERIATLWRMRGTSGRAIECAAFRTETGLELRTMYSPEEIIASQLFRGVDAEDKLAEAADRWRLPQATLQGLLVDHSGSRLRARSEESRQAPSQAEVAHVPRHAEEGRGLSHRSAKGRAGRSVR